MKYEAVIFDLFHTLVSVTASGDPGPQPYEVVGVPEEEWFAVWRRHEERWLKGQCGSVTEIVSDVVRDLELGCSPATREWRSQSSHSTCSPLNALALIPRGVSMQETDPETNTLQPERWA